ncbi:unnamed protein product [Tilletia controversa]|nr:unnamed protein product [Tilletia controversa]CAD6916066.1 unnamed protein product [Tilletia controversa]
MASATLARSTGASFLSARSWAPISSSSPLAPAPFPLAGPSRLPQTLRLADPLIARRTFSTSQVCAAQAADFYSVLNVPRTASQTDIKRQFYQLSKRYHPDVNRDDDDAKRKFQEVSEAYATLGQERSRRAYDAGRSSSSSSSYAQYNTSGGASSMNAERRARAAYAWDYTRRRSDSSRARAARGASDAHSSGKQAFGGFGRGGAGPETSFGTHDEHPADRLERLGFGGAGGGAWERCQCCGGMMMSTAHQRNTDVVAPHVNSKFNFSTSTQSLLGSTDANQEATPHKTGLVYCAAMGLHAPPDATHSHPEKPERILRIYASLRSSGCLARMRRIVPRPATKSEIELFHESGMYEGLQRTADSSLYLNEHTALCARLSCGSVIEMCDAVASRRIRNGFAVVRPPGHHAEASRAMGFCFYNNVVVATKFLQQKYSRGKDSVDKVLILDWDVHHGNGTQQAFFDVADTLYISLHRYEDGDYYPGGVGGASDQVGTGPGKGTNVNVPWPCSGMGDGDYLYAFQRIIMPIAQEYNPDFVIISAGFDAADGDEIGGMHVSPQAYAHMTQMLSSLANGRLVVVLEGGYDLDATAKSALAVTKVILGEAPEPFRANEISCGTIAQRTVQEVARVQEKYWKSISASELDPRVNDDATLNRVGVPEVIRHHRARHLWQSYNLLQVPLIRNLAPYFQHAVFASEHMLDAEAKQVLLFVHDLADLRAEKPVLKVNPHHELKAVLDVTDGVLRWAQSFKLAVFDVNLFPKKEVTTTDGRTLNEAEAILAFVDGAAQTNGHGGGGTGVTSGGGAQGVGPATSGPGANTKLLTSTEQQARAINELVLYIWDNFIELSHPDTKVVVLGHGIRAGHALMNLFVERDTEVRRRVAGCSMVFGGLGTSLGTTLPVSAWVGNVANGGASGSGSGGSGAGGGMGANGGSFGNDGSLSGMNGGPMGGANAGPAPTPHMHSRQRDANRRLPSSSVSELPLVPSTHPELRKWYKKHSKIVCAHDHPMFVWDLLRAVGRKAGEVEQSEAFTTTEVMLGSWSGPQGIAEFFQKALDLQPI